MIVTCPGCAAKYRVRDDAVPESGAELKCPSCATVFVAHRPRHSEAELQQALRAQRAPPSVSADSTGSGSRALRPETDPGRAAFTLKVEELERRLAEAERRAAAAESRAHDADARLFAAETRSRDLQHAATAAEGKLSDAFAQLVDAQSRLRETEARTQRAAGAEAALAQAQERARNLEAQKRTDDATIATLQNDIRTHEASILVLKSELSGAQSDLRHAVQPLEAERNALRAQIESLQKADVRAHALSAELTAARQASADVKRLEDEVVALQRSLGRVRADLEVAQHTESALKSELARMKSESTDPSRRALLESDLARARSGVSAPATLPPNIAPLIAAVTPMLWGFEQALAQLNSVAAKDATLTSHVRQMQLLHGVLKRLAAEAQNLGL